MLDNITHEDESLVFRRFGSLDELFIEVIRAHRVWELTKVHFQQGRHRMDVLEDSFVVVQIRHPILVEGDAQLLDVGRDPGEAVDPVNDAASFDEFGTMDEHFGHFLAGVQQMF